MVSDRDKKTVSGEELIHPISGVTQGRPFQLQLPRQFFIEANIEKRALPETASPPPTSLIGHYSRVLTAIRTILFSTGAFSRVGSETVHSNEVKLLLSSSRTYRITFSRPLTCTGYRGAPRRGVATCETARRTRRRFPSVALPPAPYRPVCSCPTPRFGIRATHWPRARRNTGTNGPRGIKR